MFLFMLAVVSEEEREGSNKSDSPFPETSQNICLLSVIQYDMFFQVIVTHISVNCDVGKPNVGVLVVN